MYIDIRYADYSNPNKNTYLSENDQRLIKELIKQMSCGGEMLGLPHQEERFPKDYKYELVSNGVVKIVLSEEAPVRTEVLDVKVLKEQRQKLQKVLDRLSEESRERRLLRERLQKLEDAINNGGIVKTVLYGVFLTDPEPNVVLYMGNIRKNKQPDLVRDATLVHELFHAWNFFCSECSRRTVPAIDEAIVEYETLCFLDRISKAAEDVVEDSWVRDHFHKVYEWQLDALKDKQLSVGLLAAYGYGAYIFEDDTQLELLKAYPPLSGKLSVNDPDVKKAVSLLTPVYPYDNEALALRHIIDALNKMLPINGRINSKYRAYWTRFVKLWLSGSPNATTSMLNTLCPQTDSSDYLPEPWWGNDGNSPLDSVCVNLNPGRGDVIQLRNNVAGIPMYNPAVLASRLPRTDAWHRDKRAMPIAKALWACGCSASGTNAGHLDIELVPWHSEHATSKYGFNAYVKNYAPDIFNWSLSFAADESRRISNRVLRNTVLIKTSATNADYLFKAFFKTKAIQHPVTKSEIYTLPNLNTCWCIYTLLEFPDIRFVSIWRKKGYGLNNFPSDADMFGIFRQL